VTDTMTSLKIQPRIVCSEECILILSWNIEIKICTMKKCVDYKNNSMDFIPQSNIGINDLI